MNMSFLMEHTVLGFCWWDLIALIIVIAVIVFFVVKHNNMKNEESNLEDQLADLYAADTVEDKADTVEA